MRRLQSLCPPAVAALGAAAILFGPAPALAAAGAVGGDAASYEYRAEGKRDPFRPFVLQREGIAGTAPLTPLQRYEIGQLKLVGVVYNVTPPRAMVEDDQGLGFILTPGTPVGPNGGVVTAIEPRQVVVVEWATDVIGERHRREYVLELPADEGGTGR